MKTLTVDNKDVRKVDWNNKEVCVASFVSSHDEGVNTPQTQLIETGVTPHYVA